MLTTFSVTLMIQELIFILLPLSLVQTPSTFNPPTYYSTTVFLSGHWSKKLTVKSRLEVEINFRINHPQHGLVSQQALEPRTSELLSLLGRRPLYLCFYCTILLLSDALW